MSKSYTDVVQGSPEWHAIRAGKVTASRVADILRKVKSGGASAMRQRYLGELVSERLTGKPYLDAYKSADMARGNEMEDEARQVYALAQGEPVERIAFVDHPSIPWAGCSPDTLVGAAGLAEHKCPATHTHIATLRGAPVDADYLTQIQWQLACTGRQWCDYVSYDSRLPAAMQMSIVRINRDPVRIVELETAVKTFLIDVDTTLADLKAQYHVA